VAAWSTRLANDRRIASIVAAGLAAAPSLVYAQVSVQRPAQAILQMVSIGFAAIAALGILFCCIAGAFGMAQWTRLLNIIGWTFVGGAALSIGTWAASTSV
jgi:type IV secretory pathway VirB2 component (pilin)